MATAHLDLEGIRERYGIVRGPGGWVADPDMEFNVLADPLSMAVFEQALAEQEARAQVDDEL